MDRTTLQVTQEGHELDEVIIAGVEQYYDTKAEQFRALIGLSQHLRHHRLTATAATLERYVEVRLAECREAGVCPYCGEDVKVEEHKEHHPAPFGLGTAVERTAVYVCSGTCGEV